MRLAYDFTHGIVNNVYSLSKMLQLDAYYSGMLRNIVAITRTHFQYFDGASPPAGHAERNRLIVLRCIGVDVAMQDTELTLQA